MTFAIETQIKSATINFRAVKNKDDKGNAINGADGKPTYTTREKIDINLSVPTRQAIIDLFVAASQEDATNDVIKSADQVDEVIFGFLYEQACELAKQNTSLTSANFPLGDLDWIKLATAPEAERKSRGISKEQWADFAEDYLATMPEITGKTEDRIKKAVATFLLKFSNVAADKEALRILQGQLVVYLEKAPSAANYVDVLEYLNKKLDALLEAEVVTKDDF